MLKVLFITDSLGLPRMMPSKVKGEEVWNSILESELHSLKPNNFKFFKYLKAGLTTSEIKKELETGQILAYEPDVVLLQIGIVDCYPRALKQYELLVISKIPIINKIFRYLIKRFYSKIIKFRNISYVSQTEFKKNLIFIKEKYKDVKILAIPIGPANINFCKKNPLIEKNINIYNSILEEIFGKQYIKNSYHNVDVEKLFLSDNHHLSLYGNQILAANLLKYLKEEF